ncbi:YcaO-like family protein [Piscinibacter terrae]|uniref:YcaO-like family protein n=1 Tax=Piscinibacter terrae TaxID=2496871 RepID=UPI0013872859|nr:YcaO-like family protein [Albitalea terrae]
MKRDDAIANALADPGRLCPVLAMGVMIRGRELKARLHEQEHVVKAPPRFLQRLYDWCDGSRSLADIRALAQAPGYGESFCRFVDALLDAGLLVDAARSLIEASQVARYPSWTGQAAPPETWRQLIAGPMAETPAWPATARALPEPLDSPLLRLVEQRQSAIAFGDAPVSAAQLGAMLQAMYGANAEGTHRAVASAGGFYPLHITLCLMKAMDDRPPGVYRVHYARAKVGLERIDAPDGFLPRAFMQPLRLQGAAFALVVSCDLQPGSLKYRNRFFQYAFTEAGAVMNNAALACVEVGLGLRTLGGFDEDMLSRMLALDGRTPLIASVGGSLPGADARPRRSVRASWSLGLPSRSFNAASACVRGADGAWGNPCWGRDQDPKLALDKAIAEAVERSAYRQRGACMEAPAHALDRPWLHPDRFVAYSPAQHRQAGFPFARFDENEPRLWTECRHAITGEPVLVLADLVFHRNSFDPDYAARLVTHASSSGCASHRSREQAVSAAVCELIERDAFSRHWLAQRAGVAVALKTLPAKIAALAADLAGRHVQVQVQRLDASWMPVWFVWMQSEQAGFTTVAAASGFGPEAALESAFFEAHTAALVRLASRQPTGIAARAVRTPRDHADLYAQRRYFRRADALCSNEPQVDFGTAVAGWCPSFEALRAGLAAHGRDIVVADLSLPDAPTTWDGTPIVTVRALAPGLVPLGFGAGRMPLGMGAERVAGGEFPHPFP